MDFIKQLAGLAPSLAELIVLVYVVKMFLAHMGESRLESLAQNKELHEGHMQARQDTRIVLTQLAESMNRLAEAVRQSNHNHE